MNPSPIQLDYAPNPRLIKTRKYLRRALGSLLILFAIALSSIAWLYQDWRNDQQAFTQIGISTLSETIPIPIASQLLPARFSWLLERTTEVQFYSAMIDRDLQNLKRLKYLEYLSVYSSHITDSGLVHLRTLKTLTKLDLRFTKVTDAGLVHLKGLTKLQLLLLDRTNVTSAGVADLQKSLPNCRIQWDDNQRKNHD